MSEQRYRIGPLTLQPHRQLLMGDTPVVLGRKALELLSVLAEAEGDLVTKDELMSAVWPDVTIEENAVQVHMTALRKALGDAAGQLQTVRSLGYRLLKDGSATALLPDIAESGTVAILPFANQTGDSGLDFLGEAVAEELINQLSHVPGLHVSSRTSSFAYKGHDGDIRRIARELNVAAIVEGSVRNSADTIRITAQLVDGTTGYYRWSENFDRYGTDLLALEDELASLIAPVLSGLLHAETKEPPEPVALVRTGPGGNSPPQGASG
jgi:TolB-like protein